MNNFVPVVGSFKNPLRESKSAGKPDPDSNIEVTVMLRAGKESDFAPTDRDDIEKVKNFAKSYRLKVLSSEAEKHTMVLLGRLKDISDAFDVDLKLAEHPEGKFRTRSGNIMVPKDISDIVQGVFGLDDRPQASPHFRILDSTQKKTL